MEGLERRPFTRYRLLEALGVLSVAAEGGGDRRIVRIANISQGGTMVVARSELRVGDVVNLVVNLATLGLHCRGEVVWRQCTEGRGPGANRMWAAGVRFRGLGGAERAQIERLRADPVRGSALWTRARVGA